MTSHKTAEVISLILTTPTILLAAAVFVVWWRSAVAAIRVRERESIHWFIMGVFFGFIGQFLDNIYWGIAWSLSFADSDLKDAYFENGVYYNIISRQLCGTVAAFFHLLAAVKSRNDALRLVYFLGLALTVGSVITFSIFTH